jgi:hypothetical protein
VEVPELQAVIAVVAATRTLTAMPAFLVMNLLTVCLLRRDGWRIAGPMCRAPVPRARRFSAVPALGQAFGMRFPEG